MLTARDYHTVPSINITRSYYIISTDLFCLLSKIYKW